MKFLKKYSLLIGCLIVVLLNILSANLFFRIDLTSDKRHSVSQPTKQLMAGLNQEVDVTIYLDGEMNSGFLRLKRSVAELLDELSIYAPEGINYSFTNPTSLPQEEQKRLMQLFAENGISPTTIYERNRDGKSVQRLLFPWLRISYGDKQQWVSLLKNIKGNNSYKLGYWLEAMLVYCLKNAIKNLEEEEERFKGYFTEIRHSVVLNEQYEVNEKNEDGKFCEFDVVLLTKTGQIVIFECKTGLVKSEVTKSRMYTAYAAGGVYGMPILIPPYLSYDNKRAVQQGEEGVWKKMKDTRNAALRSQMPVWHLDEIKEKLKDLFDEVAL